jgi:caffeoyl-CoA O-methyltransferase
MELSIAPEPIEEYARRHTTPDSPSAQAVAERTMRTMELSRMLSGVSVGRLLGVLAHIVQAQRVLEIGTFTGYSALALAEALPEHGAVITLEALDEHADIAQANFDASPHGSRIDLRRGAALETLAQLDGPFELVFIDADKREYLDYLEAVLPMLADHGVVVVDNTLWSGRVLDPDGSDADTQALARFNDAVVADDRLTCVMLTVRDGVTLIHKRRA